MIIALLTGVVDGGGAATRDRACHRYRDPLPGDRRRRDGIARPIDCDREPAHRPALLVGDDHAPGGMAFTYPQVVLT